MTATIYHNPRCSKSRATLKLLQEKGVDLEIVAYLKTPPSASELKSVLQKLGVGAREIMRKKEAPYKQLDLGRDDLSEDALIEALVENPILIERPIVVNGNRAAIGRPPETVLDIV